MSSTNPEGNPPAPTGGTEDELLSDPPAVHLEGTLHGYRSGRRLRTVLFISIAVGVAACIGWAIWSQQRAARGVTPQYQVDDPGASEQDDSLGVLHWSTEGAARLGLMKKDGVHTIVLPDRTLRLAEDHDHAQVVVRIQDGETRSVKTVAGRVVMSSPTTPR